jgi:GT2 family glycosyltransferase
MSKQTGSPCVSVIISSWNSAQYLPACLDCLKNQTWTDFEVILVDNGSTDSSTIGVESKWSSLRINVERLETNRGFSAANNIGIRLARGKWLALLNSDAFPEPGWLSALVNASQNNPEYSFFASRLLKADAPDILDGAGDAYHISGLAWRRFAGYPAAEFGLQAEEVFSPCAAAALYLREALLKAGGFDETLFMYHEDIDLGFRLRLLGHRCLYVPQAVVRHVGSASTGSQSDFALFHGHRNYVWSFIQNMPPKLLWQSLPSHILSNIIYVINYSIRGRGKILLQAKSAAFKGLGAAIKKRKAIQSKRSVSSNEIQRVIDSGCLQPYLLGYHIRRLQGKAAR